MIHTTRACTALAALFVFAAAAATTGACGTDTNSASTNNATDGGADGASIDGSTGDAGNGDAAPGDGATPAQDAGCVEVDSGVDEVCVPPTPGGATLYLRLGGHACIRDFLTKVIVEANKDPQLSSYFVLNVPCTRPGHPTAHQLIACFTDLTGSATGGAEVYPTTSSDGWACRSMQASHAGLHVPNDAFTKFVTTAAGVAAAAGVAPADISALGALLNSTRADIVDPMAPEGGFFDGG